MGKNNHLTRRDFIKTTAGVAAMFAVPGMLRAEGTLTATDVVTLGNSGIKVSRLGMGIGTHSGQVQRGLGQEEFNRLFHYALDKGITLIDTADNYDNMHEMLKIAKKGVDRSKLQIQTKIPWGKYQDPIKELDRFRQEVDTDYFDMVLIHCVTTGDWVEQQKPLMELLDKAKDKGIIKASGVSVHGYAPLLATTGLEWGDVRLLRVNHNGSYMDKMPDQPVDVNAVVANIQKMHDQGKGIIGMKLIGNGDFTDADVRKKSIHYVMSLKCVDSVIIGFKSPAEIDEAILNMNTGLAARG